MCLCFVSGSQHTHTHTRTHTHAHTHTCTHTHTHTHTHMTCTSTITFTYTHTHMHTHTYTIGVARSTWMSVTSVRGLPARLLNGAVLRTLDCHAGGEPARVVLSGAAEAASPWLKAGASMMAARFCTFSTPHMHALRRAHARSLPCILVRCLLRSCVLACALCLPLCRAHMNGARSRALCLPVYPARIDGGVDTVKFSWSIATMCGNGCCWSPEATPARMQITCSSQACREQPLAL